ncbi:MAG: potassium transporter TrkG [Acidimicrobiales bacterium]|nr:potassium transporter TrkG [Acidimicrobiales bacterium]
MSRPMWSGKRSEFRRSVLWPSWAAAVVWAVSVALGAAGLLAIASGVVDLLGAGDHTVPLLVCGSATGLLASVLAVWVRSPERIQHLHVLSAVTGCLILFILLIAGFLGLTEPSMTLADALFQATAMATTTALDIGAIDTTGHGVRFLAGGAQWLGGIGALLMAVAILPFLGAGGEFADRSRRGGRRPMTPNPAAAVRNLCAVHGLATAVTLVGFLIVGVDPLDAVLLAMATASTGGLFSGSDLESAAVQWVAIAGMIIAGSSLVVLWRLGLGRSRSLLRSSELRAYLGLLVVAPAAFLLWTDGSGVDGIRRAVFTVTAAVTTTGFPMGPGGTWAPAAPVLLLVLASIGPMTGSTGGGFQILRHQLLARVAVRELLRQLHPRAIITARLGRRTAAEDTLTQVVVTQFLFVSVIFGTVGAMAITGFDLATALAAAVHAISTAGPIRSLDGSLVDVGSWPTSARLALIPAMVIGRLSVYPAIVALGAGAALIRQRLRLKRRAEVAVSRGSVNGLVDRGNP